MTDRARRQAEIISREAKRSGTCRRLKSAQSGQVKIAKHGGSMAPNAVSRQVLSLQAVDKAQSALDKAEREHAERAGAIQAEADAIEKRAEAENARWKKEKERLDAALQRARARVPSADASAQSCPAIRSYSERILSLP